MRGGGEMTCLDLRLNWCFQAPQPSYLGAAGAETHISEVSFWVSDGLPVEVGEPVPLGKGGCDMTCMGDIGGVDVG